MDISFIIPLFNGIHFTKPMLESLIRTIPCDISYEIIIVDNASTDETREWLKNLTQPNLKIILNDLNIGYAKANNQAAMEASGKYLVLLNNDLLLSAHWFEPLYQTIQNYKTVIVGNVQLSSRSDGVDHAGIFFDWCGWTYHFKPSVEFIKNQGVYEVPAITAACAIVDRAWFITQGGFDEGYLNGYEDVDLCLKAKSQGYKIFVAAKSIIHHYGRASEGRHNHEEANSLRFKDKWYTYAVELSSIKPPTAS